MNLELLDPFRRQIPDRVDATLNLPSSLHFKSSGSNNKASKKQEKKNKSEDNDFKAANQVAFNRRGTYIAVTYGSGTVGVFDVMSRTLSGLYRGNVTEEDISAGTASAHSLTSVSWSRRSRTIVTGAAGDTMIRVIDNTHPFGPEECCAGVSVEEGKEKGDDEQNHSPAAESIKKNQLYQSWFVKSKTLDDHHKKSRELKIKILETSKDAPDLSKEKRERQSHIPVGRVSRKRHPLIQFTLPLPLGSFLHVHPRDTNAGLAALNDGSLVAFWVPFASWEDNGEGSDPEVKVATIFQSTCHFITSASFDPHGDRIYAGTNEGKLLGFEVASVYNHLAGDSAEISQIQPNFTISIPGRATVWDIVVSRNCKNLLVNSSDAAIRFYTTNECWTTPGEVEKPSMIFQDVVSKTKFASCDISGDSEFVVGGANGNDNKYELYIWNTSTGALMDKLIGATVELSSVSWHPTRSFLAVAASDGLVDIWGPRINWTAFAPDFQALPQNVEYVECEDEFDIVEDDKLKGSNQEKGEDEMDENTIVDVLAIEPVPVFASDSEDESDVFSFQTKITRVLGGIAS
jgi:hypothetical protein